MGRRMASGWSAGTFSGRRKFAGKQPSWSMQIGFLTEPTSRLRLLFPENVPLVHNGPKGPGPGGESGGLMWLGLFIIHCGLRHFSWDCNPITLSKWIGTSCRDLRSKWWSCRRLTECWIFPRTIFTRSNGRQPSWIDSDWNASAFGSNIIMALYFSYYPQLQSFLYFS